MKTVLIVEDCSNLAMFTARGVQAAIKDVDVLVAFDCSQARKMARTRQPDLLLIDVTLPDGNGFSLAEELHGDLQAAKFVLTSGHPLVKGAGDPFLFLSKPYGYDELKSTLLTALGHKNKQARPEPCAWRSTISLSGEDLHWVFNRLSAVMSGLKAFELGLIEDKEDPQAVGQHVDEYVDRLCSIVRGISDRLKDEVKKNE
jgi:DNA-binding NtrC family response regulator